MISNTREKSHPNKQEGRSTTDDHKALPITSSRLWSGLKNPRIVRVSRASGGKDRHSKVSTVRGLRDRRVRLSVPTAIQLYDLQERLGLNQPSKVVDWLLNACQHEIDKLPPLQLSPGNFVQFPQSLPISQEATPTGAPEYANKAKMEELATFATSNFWNSDSSHSFQQESVEEKELAMEKNNIINKGNEVVNAQALSHDPLPRTGHSLVPAGLLSNAMAYTSYYHWEASNAYLSQFGIHSSQVEAPNMLIPSSRSLAPEPQIVFCTPPGVIPSVFQSYVATPAEFDVKQINHLQMVSSTSQNQLPSNSARNLHSDGPETRPFH